jgi:hypothetical protein
MSVDEWAQMLADVHDSFLFGRNGGANARELEEFQRLMHRWNSKERVRLIISRAPFYTEKTRDPRTWDAAGGF